MSNPKTDYFIMEAICGLHARRGEHHYFHPRVIAAEAELGESTVRAALAEALRRPVHDGVAWRHRIYGVPFETVELVGRDRLSFRAYRLLPRAYGNRGG
jgi:hypothetical protein